MDHFRSHPELYNKPIRLDEKKVIPIKIIKKFFQDFTLSEIRQILWDWFEVAITSENDQYAESEERANLLYRYHRIEELVEAAFILYQSTGSEGEDNPPVDDHQNEEDKEED